MQCIMLLSVLSPGSTRTNNDDNNQRDGVHTSESLSWTLGLSNLNTASLDGEQAETQLELAAEELGQMRERAEEAEEQLQAGPGNPHTRTTVSHPVTSSQTGHLQVPFVLSFSWRCMNHVVSSVQRC